MKGIATDTLHKIQRYEATLSVQKHLKKCEEKIWGDSGTQVTDLSSEQLFYLCDKITLKCDVGCDAEIAKYEAK